MIDAQVLTFTVVAAALTLSPGADTMLVVRNVLRGGRHDGVVTTFGICSGLFLRSAVRRWLEGLCGLVLVGLGARLALERQ
jgi:threonine/homoserine/homoserine lactone efflux protein